MVFNAFRRQNGAAYRYLDVSDLADDFEAVEVCSHLGHVVDHGGNTEEGRRAAEFLQNNSNVQRHMQRCVHTNKVFLIPLHWSRPEWPDVYVIC